MHSLASQIPPHTQLHAVHPSTWFASFLEHRAAGSLATQSQDFDGSSCLNHSALSEHVSQEVTHVHVHASQPFVVPASSNLWQRRLGSFATHSHVLCGDPDLNQEVESHADDWGFTSSRVMVKKRRRGCHRAINVFVRDLIKAKRSKAVSRLQDARCPAASASKACW